MKHDQLRDLLARSAAAVPVSPPPVVEVGHGARRRQSQRLLATAAALVFVVGIVGGAAIVGGPESVEPTGRPIDLPTSDVDLGGREGLHETMGSPVGGTLSLDDRDCVVVNGESLLWPEGWTAESMAGGFDLRDHMGNVVARDGDRIETTSEERTRSVDHRCTDGDEQMAVVNGPLFVVDVDLPTSDWDGGEAMAAGIGGIIRVGLGGCVWVGDHVAVWPADFTARNAVDGLEILGSDSEVVAREGDEVETGGGYVEGSPDHPCTVTQHEVAVIQAEVRAHTP